MLVSFAQLLQRAITIKKETVEEANSAQRVGSLLEDMINYFSEGGGGGEGSGVQIITIDELSDLDLLPQGVYLINGAAEGLLVVVDSIQPEVVHTYSFNVAFRSFSEVFANNSIKRAILMDVTPLIDGDTIVRPPDLINDKLDHFEDYIKWTWRIDTSIWEGIYPYYTNVMTDQEYTELLATRIELFRSQILSVYHPEWVGVAIPTEGSTITV